MSPSDVDEAKDCLMTLRRIQSSVFKPFGMPDLVFPTIGSPKQRMSEEDTSVILRGLYDRNVSRLTELGIDLSGGLL